MKRKTNTKKSAVIFLVLAIFFSAAIFFSGAINAQDKTPNNSVQRKSDSDANIEEYEVIKGVAQNFRQDEKNGIILFWGNVRMTRENGYLNADKVNVYRDVETDDVIRTVAEGNVDMKDGDLYATCDHALLNEADDTIELTGSVVVIQKKDRVEAPYIKYNRKTGIREGKGNESELVRFRVRLQKKQKEESASSGETSEEEKGKKED